MTAEAGGLDGAVAYLNANPSPQVLIVESALPGDQLLTALDALADVVAPETRVVILGGDNDIALYRRLIAMGIAEYLVGPIDGAELAETVFNICFGGTDDTLGKLVAVYGLRGGVGASTVAANLAYALARSTNDDVVLADLDLWFGTAALALNLTPKQTVADALVQPERLDDVLLDRFLLKYDNRLSVLGAPQTPNVASPPDSESLDQLLGILRGRAGHVVVDLPHLWAPWVRDVMLDASDLVVVGYPDLANLRDGRNLFDVLGAARGVDRPVHLVLNRDGASRKGELAPKDFEDSLGTRPRQTVPFDPSAFGLAMNNGEPVQKTAPNSAAAKAFARLAATIGGQAPTSGRRPGGAKGPSKLARLFRRAM